MKRIETIWSRLVAAARQVPDNREVSVPTGFSTRVVSRGLSVRRGIDTWVERFAMRMVGVSCLVALFAVATYVSTVDNAATSSSSDAIFQIDDAAALIVGDVSNE